MTVRLGGPVRRLMPWVTVGSLVLLMAGAAIASSMTAPRHPAKSAPSSLKLPAASGTPTSLPTSSEVTSPTLPPTSNTSVSSSTTTVPQQATTTTVPSSSPSGTWTVSPEPPNFYGGGAVSCTDPTFCMAIGRPQADDPIDLVAAQWEGSEWSPVPIVSASTGPWNEITQIACTSPTFCMAVGNGYGNGTNQKPLSEEWNGSTWSVVPTPGETGSMNASLQGVSCVGSTFCVAVGYSTGNVPTGPYNPLVELWNGTTWTLSAGPPVQNNENLSLSSVSCPLSTFCVAVSGYEPTGPYNHLITTWNGATWSTAPDPSNGSLVPLDVSCSAPSSCVVVASNGFNSSYVETYNGSTWALFYVTPPLGQLIFLTRVSCSDDGCSAAGSGATLDLMTGGPVAGEQNSAVVEGSGRNWSNVTTPDIGGLDYLSCASNNWCMAAGPEGFLVRTESG